MNPTLHYQRYCWHMPAFYYKKTSLFLVCFILFVFFSLQTNANHSNNHFFYKKSNTSTSLGLNPSAMVCNDLLNLTLNHKCEAGISIDHLLEAPSFGANIYYTLQLNYENEDLLSTTRIIGSPTTGTTAEDLAFPNIYGNSINEILTPGQRLTYMVKRFTSTIDNNNNPIEIEESCWGYLIVEDKNGPVCQLAMEEELLINYDIDCDNIIENNVNDPSGIDDLKDEYILCTLIEKNGIRPYFDILEAHDADLNDNGIFGESGIDVEGDFADCSGIDYIYFDDEYWQICDLNDAIGLPIDESRFNPQLFEVIEVYKRTWFAVDQLGYTSDEPCSQYVFALRPKASQIILEEEIISPCEIGESELVPYFTVNQHIEHNGTGSDGPDFEGDKPYFLPSNGISCKYSVSFHEDEPIQLCATAYKKSRHWTIANCCNGDLIYDEFTQLMKVSDEIGPNIWLDADQDGAIDLDADGEPILADGAVFTLNTSFFNCFADGNIWTLLTSDNCAPDQAEIFNVRVERVPTSPHDHFFFVHEFPNGGNLVDELPADAADIEFSEGRYFLHYFAQDDCGNVSTAILTMFIEDERAPVAVCNDELNVTLTNFEGNLLARVEAEDLDDTSEDNCKSLGYLVRSHDNTDTIDDDWGAFAQFSCEDVDKEDLKVELLVFEDRNQDGNFIDVVNNATGFNAPDGIDDIDNGLSSTCWTFVNVEDKAFPVITCEDKVIDCDDVNLEALRQNSFTEDTDGDALADAYYWPPTFFGGCFNTTNSQLNLSILDLDYNEDCNYGTFIRRWTISKIIDGTAHSASCDQTVTVHYKADWTMTFPRDVLIECTPEAIEIPEAANINDILINDGCTQWGMEVQDETFDIVGQDGEGACFKIIRTYQFINTCTWDPTNTEIAVVNRPEGLLENNPVQLRHRSRDFGYNDFGDEDDDDPYNEIISEMDITDAVLPPSPTPTNIDDDDGALVLIDNDFSAGDDPQGTIFLFQRQYNERINDNDNVLGVYAENYGYFAYRQVIKIKDSQAPIISPLDDLILCDTMGLCGVDVTLFAPEIEECRTTYLTFYTITNEDGTVVDEGEFPIGAMETDSLALGFFPLGNYEVSYQVFDGCGNQTVENFQLSINDCKAPTAYCLFLLSVDLSSEGLVELWAEDFDAGSFDACCEPIHFSFNEAGDSTSVQFTCDDVGSNPIDLWASDACGNSAFCSTFVIVQSNVNSDGTTQDYECEDIGSFVPIAGAISTESGLGAEQVTVHINSSSNTVLATNVEGQFHTNLPVNNDYSIVPENNTHPFNGVSTLDLLLIKKHILGITPLASPYRMIAADINRSKSISTADLVQLRKLILNIETTFPNNTSWRFIPTSYTFPNPENPWAEVFPEIINLNNLAETENNLDFTAIKIGDVNDNALPNFFVTTDDRSQASTSWMLIKEQNLDAHNTYQIDVKAKDLADLEGYQFTLAYDTGILDLVEIKEGLSKAEHFGIFEEKGNITTSWIGQGQADDVLFSLVFKTYKKALLSEVLSINSSLIKAEAYAKHSAEVLDIQLQFEQQMPSVILYPNTPNPFDTQTNTRFSLPESAKVQIVISDRLGQVFYKKEEKMTAGYQSFVLDRKNLPEGLLMLSIKTKWGVKSQKVMVLKK